MATKKKIKKVTKSKRRPAKKVTTARRSAKKKTAKKVTAKKRGRSRKTPTRSQPESAVFEQGVRSRSGAQAGDLQGLRDTESADSESVDELLEEGNAFEADVVAGVEHADDDQEREVHTHEVPEDDVPEEYRDKE
jgi:hypothetical protein